MLQLSCNSYNFIYAEEYTSNLRQLNQVQYDSSHALVPRLESGVIQVIDFWPATFQRNFSISLAFSFRNLFSSAFLVSS